MEKYPGMRQLPVSDRWCVHSYYTLCPYAPDDSGRILLAGADLEEEIGEVLILSEEGKVIDRFGKSKIAPSFFHTGFWQTWGPEGKHVYYKTGSLIDPGIVRRELKTGREIMIKGGMQGAPPTGEPIISGLLGMLYAAGYGNGIYSPAEAPVPFQERDKHGLFQYLFDPLTKELLLSVAEVIKQHPDRDKLSRADREIKERLGSGDGLTLMIYCVRWNPAGDRFLFFFGNHCVVKERGEPRLTYVFTADRDLNEVHLALDLSFDRRGVHWSWHPDGEHLVGYGPDPEQPDEMCLAQVRYDGTDYQKISKHNSGGHPCISPVNYELVVTDEPGRNPGEVVFIDLKNDKIMQRYQLPRVNRKKEPPGRNPYRVCHHPVFSHDGTRVLINTLPGRLAVVSEIKVNLPI